MMTELPRLIEAQRAELKAGASARRDLEDELNTHRARALYDATPPDSAGIRRALVEGESGIESRRGLAQRYTALPKTILVALSTTPPAVLVAASADSGMDAGATLKGVLERVGGRGGGSPRLAQGTVPTLEALERVRRELSG
jgi:alanyl-tRNA synthetase